MARVLIVGCGCRGQALARSLVADGHAVRGTTRDRGRVPAIEAAGAEAFVGDPDRIGTLVYALEHVTLVVWLMATAEPADVHAALNGPRLGRMLEEVIDTTVRGFVLEGTAGEAVAVEESRRSEIPLAVVHVDPADHERWLTAMRAAVDGLLES